MLDIFSSKNLFWIQIKTVYVCIYEVLELKKEFRGGGNAWLKPIYKAPLPVEKL